MKLLYSADTLTAEFALDNHADTWECACRAIIRDENYSGKIPTARRETAAEAFHATQDALKRLIKNLPKKPKKADLTSFDEWVDAEWATLNEMAEIDADERAGKALAEGEAVEEAAAEKAALEHVREQEAELAGKIAGKQEKETLMADAFRLMGRIEGVKMISEIGDAATLLMLNEVKKSKIYKDMPGVGTWENYCESIGCSRRYIDERLENLQTLGSQLLEATSTFGIGFKDMRALRAAAKDGTLAITDDRVIIDVAAEEVDEEPKKLEIPYANRDELREVLAEVIEEKSKQIKAAREAVKEKDHAAKIAARQMDSLAKENRKLEEKLKVFTDGGEIKGMPVEDYPAYERLLAAQLSATELFNHLKGVVNELDELSEANQHYLGGVVFYVKDLVDRLLADIGVRGVVMDRIYNPDDQDAPLKGAYIPGLQMAPGHKA